MKNIIVSFLTIILICSYQIQAQKIIYNLKNLDKLKVVIVDQQNVFSDILSKKLITETKLQLMTAGIKAGSEEDKCPILQLCVNYIASKFAEHRVLVQFIIIEHVKTNRKSSIETDAISYYDFAFFIAKDVSSAAYDKLKDEMIIRFIEKYLNDKTE